MRRRAVLFDLYGTLIDIQTDEQDMGVYSALSQYLAYNLVKISPEDLKKEYFEEVRMSLVGSSEPYPDVDVYGVFREIMHRRGRVRYPKPVIAGVAMLFRALTIRRFGLFPNVIGALTSIAQRYKTALISDAQWVFTGAEMQMLGLERFFRLKVFSSRMGYKKPDTRLFHGVMKRLWVRPEDCLYIGDNPDKDLKGAKNSGMKCILFRTGVGPYDGLKADACFNNFVELEDVIEGLFKAQ